MTGTDYWTETSGIIVLVLGLLIIVAGRNTQVNYILILISGLFVGRVHYIRRHKRRAPFYIITAMYLIGVIIGLIITQNGSVFWALVIFFVGTYFGKFLTKTKRIH